MILLMQDEIDGHQKWRQHMKIHVCIHLLVWNMQVSTDLYATPLRKGGWK